MATFKTIEKIKKKYEVGRIWDPMVHNPSCPLCLKPFVPQSKNGQAVFDHCHRCGGKKPTGKKMWAWRGFICSLCNTAEPHRHRKVAGRGIQHLIRDPEWQNRLQIYLDAHICPQK